MGTTRSPLRVLAATLALAGLVGAVVGCGSSAVTPAPSMSAEQTACLGDPLPQTHVPRPVIPIVVRIDAGADSAILLAGKAPNSSDLTLVWPCRIERLAGGNVLALDSGGGTLTAPPDPTLSLDQAWKSSDRPDGMVAGRVGPNVANVEVDLADGTQATTAVANGYYLGWWRGTTADPVRITAFDAGGKVLRVIADAAGLLPPK
jgi:hypothetical protein